MPTDLKCSEHVLYTGAIGFLMETSLFTNIVFLLLEFVTSETK